MGEMAQILEFPRLCDLCSKRAIATCYECTKWLCQHCAKTLIVLGSDKGEAHVFCQECAKLETQ